MAPRRRLRVVAAPAAPTLIRAAIYTRKSTAAGLDSHFTSLHNQRERAEAYIDSQRDQGWIVIATEYDDGGFSGGNLDRPALQRLLADIETSDINAIVVYRLDRLSRSLADFIKIHELLEKHGVALVSVTESINTSTPHGRMMVNVLLSFAQYERELASQRTSHKLQAARRKGKFTGGYPVLGYDCDPAGGKLVVNHAEAEQVREIFRLFLERRSLVATAEELRRRGWTLKRWTTKEGRAYGGTQFNKVNLRRLLTNHVYIGKVEFDGEIYDGEHKAIVPVKIFREVQTILESNCRDRGALHRNRHGALLRQLIRCAACGTPMVHAPTKKNDRTYRYYRCAGSMRNGRASCPTGAIPADRAEAFIVDEIRRIGADQVLQRATFEQAVSQVRAMKRGLDLERRRLKKDKSTVQAEVARLVDAVARLNGPAADAVAGELATAQERLATIESRQAEVKAELETLDAQTINRDELTRALIEFEGLWSVLLTTEKERVLRLLIDRVDYHGGTGKLAITWRLGGFGQLVEEIGT